MRKCEKWLVYMCIYCYLFGKEIYRKGIIFLFEVDGKDVKVMSNIYNC